MVTLWIRTEYVAHENRAILTPEHAEYLVKQGHNIVVEKSPRRVFGDDEYERVGCTMVPAGRWEEAPESAIILGLKKIPDDNFPLIHWHVYFAHAYNHKRIFVEKSDANNLIRRFLEGKGKHFDLEFLTDEQHRRVCSFGYYAGIVGAYFALCLWYEKRYKNKQIFDYSNYYNNRSYFYNAVNVYAQHSKPTILVLGAAGRCGSGVTEILEKHNMEYTTWGRCDTQLADRIKNIIHFDIVINCIAATEETCDLITPELLSHNDKLSVISDIGCETSSNNPIKIYKGTTSYDNLSHKIQSSSGVVDVIAIDNLPSFFPRESSYYFSSQFMPRILDFIEGKKTSPWINAGLVFEKSCQNLILSLRKKS